MTPTERPCPGCGGERGQQVCCDPCWDRLPAKLPIGPGGALMTWRRRIPQARMTRDWKRLERIFEAIRSWLADHPVRVA